MTPEEAGRMIAELRLAGYLVRSYRELPDGRALALEDEFVVGPAGAGDDRVAVLAAMREALLNDGEACS